MLHRYVPLNRALLTWNLSSEGRGLYAKIIARSTEAATTALNLRELHARGANGEFGLVYLIKVSQEHPQVIQAD